MKKKAILVGFLIFSMVTAGCGGANNGGASAETEASEGSAAGGSLEGGSTAGGSTEDSSTAGNSAEDNSAAGSSTAGRSAAGIDASEVFSNRDFEVGYDESESAVITLTGDSAECSSDAVQISGSTVTIKDEGTYLLSGTLDDGMVIIDTEKTDKTQLVLNGVSIHSESSAPIYIRQSDKVFITLAADTTNLLSNGGTFTAIDENNIDAVIFSKEDVTLNGSGTLQITSPAGHGIVSKDSLTITSGTYEISSASHALAGKDDVCIANAAFTITAGKDGIHAENADDETLGFVYIQSGSFDISAEGDGISAASNLQIEDGSFQIVSGGGSENAESKTSDAWGNFMGGGRGAGGRGEFSGGAGAPNAEGIPAGGTGNADAEGMPAGGAGDPNAGEMPAGGTGNTDAEGMPAGGAGDPNAGGMPAGGAGDPGSGMKNFPEMNPKTDVSMGADSTGSSEEDSTSIKGIKASGNLIIHGGAFTLDTADDSIHSNTSITVNGGSFVIASGDDAFHADETLTVTGGAIDISTCYEGLEGLHVEISGGDITLTASDDGLNAAGGTDESGFGGPRGNERFGGAGGSSDGTILISGGTIQVTASGDGIDANGSLEITGGTITVCGPTQGDTSTLDYDTTATITGGTFIGTGASGMAQTFSDSEQGVISVSVGNMAAGTAITLADSEGNTLIYFEPELPFAVVILSSPEIVSGETYTLTVGSSVGEFTAE